MKPWAMSEFLHFKMWPRVLRAKGAGLLTRDAFHLFSLAGPTSQFLKGMHEFSQLALAIMTLLLDKSSSVLPLQLAKVWDFRKLWQEKCMCAPWT